MTGGAIAAGRIGRVDGSAREGEEDLVERGPAQGYVLDGDAEVVHCAYRVHQSPGAIVDGHRDAVRGAVDPCFLAHAAEGLGDR